MPEARVREGSAPQRYARGCHDGASGTLARVWFAWGLRVWETVRVMTCGWIIIGGRVGT